MTQKTLKTRIARLFENGLPRMSSPATLRRIAICFAVIAAVIALLNGNPQVRAAAEQTVASPAAPLPASLPASAPASAVAEAKAEQSPVAPAANDDKPGPADHPYKVGDGVSAPRVLDKVDPAYTEEAQAAKISGTVLLSVVIGTDGLAHDINVVRGLDSGLDLNAADAIQHWHFKPGTRNGEPVAVQAQIEVNFRLQ